ncbi:hypothetical protein A4H97_19970 [Niastella yeongjuensis]|uniref:N-acetyltransferase domain-containing protein n=1 Tax=Niastella yeongjuensis TaxID=354355 RepID=A0A1V9FBW0_9BACT|nr:GNAT family N-acetyltransferase [Niastella yeongjuensis]OQP55873.1 hypothetical protein A4H97_19970 [Niastella yeongjuensis]SEP47210.1 Acetyltransferase (GNAT) domain-containing protein [Niastella yeongjuensis]
MHIFAETNRLILREIRPTDVDGMFELDNLDLGYRLIKKYWGLGIATEAAWASLAYAFSELKAPAVYAITDSNNAASHHVLLKAGLHFIETFEYHGFIHNWYQIDWETFETKR